MKEKDIKVGKVYKISLFNVEHNIIVKKIEGIFFKRYFCEATGDDVLNIGFYGIRPKHFINEIKLTR